MSLNKEIWTSQIQEILKSDNSFASALQNYSEFVNGKYVHIPNAGVPSNLISKNLSSWPISAVTNRTDADNQITMDTYYINPIVLTTPIEELEFSYNKRASVMNASMKQLVESANDGIILDMSVGATVYTGTGTARAALNASQTGNRSGITWTEIQKAQYLFNSQNIPAEGRFLLVPSELYHDITSLTQFQYSYTLTNSVVMDGYIGKLGGFQVVMRDKVLLTTSGGTLKTTQTYAATDCAAALCFSTSTVFKAVGEIKIFEKLQDPNYMADVISGYVRSKGGNLYSTPLGICVLAEKSA